MAKLEARFSNGRIIYHSEITKTNAVQETLSARFREKEWAFHSYALASGDSMRWAKH